MEFDFLQPIDDEILEYISGLTSQQLGSKIVLHTDEQFPDLNKIKIAIVDDHKLVSKALENMISFNPNFFSTSISTGKPCVSHPAFLFT